MGRHLTKCEAAKSQQRIQVRQAPRTVMGGSFHQGEPAEKSQRNGLHIKPPSIFRVFH
jgi:hypothetical protein